MIWQRWGDIFITHLIIIITSEVSTFPIVVIFFHGRVPEVVVPSFAVGFIYILGKLGFVSFIIRQSYDVRKKLSTFWPNGRICLFADYISSSSSLCRHIWRHWTSKMLVRYILSSVFLRLSQFSQLSILVQVMACCCSVPNHYLDQCWFIVKWIFRKNCQWNLNKKFSFTKSDLKFLSAKCPAYSLSEGPDVLCLQSQFFLGSFETNEHRERTVAWAQRLVLDVFVECCRKK